MMNNQEKAAFLIKTKTAEKGEGKLLKATNPNGEESEDDVGDEDEREDSDDEDYDQLIPPGKANINLDEEGDDTMMK